MASDIIGVRMTQARVAQVEALEQLTGLQGPAAVIDFALATTLAQYRAQEAGPMDTQAIAEAIYTEVYGDTDNKYSRALITGEIRDWLDDGDITPGTTVEELVAEWQEHEPAE